MAKVFRLTLHPASEGDASTLTWGEGPSIHHALVDLGRTRDYKALRPELQSTGCYDLFVISHIDADHIEGAVPLVREASPPLDPDDVWFNAYHHLVEARDRKPAAYETFSATQGEKLSEGVRRFGWKRRWNKAFEGGPVSVDSLRGKQAIGLEGGLLIRLLSPDDRKLAKLEPVWLSELKRAKLQPYDPDLEQAEVPGRERFGTIDIEQLASVPFEEDKAAPNGSSIAFLAEFSGVRVLMPADAHPGRLADSLKALGATPEKPMPIDLFKVSHHGSRANTSPELLSLVDCRRYAFSTNGTRHDHPDRETIARILKSEERRREANPNRPLAELIFNFSQQHTTCWDIDPLKIRYKYQCIFPPHGTAGIIIDVDLHIRRD